MELGYRRLQSNCWRHSRDEPWQCVSKMAGGIVSTMARLEADPVEPQVAYGQVLLRVLQSLFEHRPLDAMSQVDRLHLRGQGRAVGLLCDCVCVCVCVCVSK